MKRTMKLLAGSILIAMAPLAFAQTAADVDTQTTLLNSTAANRGQTQVATRIASDFTNLAGSTDNSLALVNALRNGTAVTLTQATTTTGTGTGSGTGSGTGTTTTTATTFTPPTGKMGWGNVFISLALAQQSLAQLGVTQPTAAQLQAALMGGDVTVNGKTTTLQGVLTMRASGMGWGQIAQSLGTKLGPVVSSIKSAHSSVATLPTSSGTTTASSAPTTKSASAKSTTVTTAGGSANASSHGIVTAGGASASAGPGSSHGQGNALGRGVVTGAGGSASGVVSAGNGNGHGAGVVTASGGSASTSVTTAQGNGASGQDHGKGHGKGGG